MAEPDIEQWRAEARRLAGVGAAASDRTAARSGAGLRGLRRTSPRRRSTSCWTRSAPTARQRFDAGYGAIALPAELGGAGLSPRYVVAFTDEEQAFEAPTVDRADQRHHRARRPDDRDLRHRRAAREVSPGPSCARICCAASCSASPEPVPTSPRSRRRRCADGRRMAASTGRRCGRPAPASPTTDCCSPGPIRTSPSRPG